MFKSQIYDDPYLKVVYETGHPVLFSVLFDGAFEKKWKPWKNRHFALRENGTLVYRKTRELPIKAKLDLRGTVITRLAIDASTNPLLTKEYGICVTCSKDGIQTSFRCILSEHELNKFSHAVQQYIPDCKIEESARALHHSVDHSGDGSLITQSSMRQAITKAMDKYETRSVKEQIMSRRGAMKFLPVYFTNDLIHGSWWFVFGSVLVVISSSIILANDYNPLLGEDDSDLSTFHYRATWVLMVVSGILFTFGSLAFVRAVHESPPMKPLFSWYHLQSDELLGSWIFLLGVLPFIPYALIYLVEEENKYIYVGALIIVLIMVLGSFLFVLSSYPRSTPSHRAYILPIAIALGTCCCSKRWIVRNLANDWLAGTWVVFWGSVVATVVCFIITIAAAANQQMLQLFIFLTAFIENFVFMIGSAYFVAGSYPEELLDEFADFDSIAAQNSSNSTSVDVRTASGNTTTSSSTDQINVDIQNVVMMPPEMLSAKNMSREESNSNDSDTGRGSGDLMLDKGNNKKKATTSNNNKQINSNNSNNTTSNTNNSNPVGNRAASSPATNNSGSLIGTKSPQYSPQYSPVTKNVPDGHYVLLEEDRDSHENIV